MPQSRQRGLTQIFESDMGSTLEQGSHSRTPQQRLQASRTGSVAHMRAGQWMGFRTRRVRCYDEIHSGTLHCRRDDDVQGQGQYLIGLTWRQQWP